jgi:Possible hemagglutinin (DUF637)/Pre-toxin domain with VENN motif
VQGAPGPYPNYQTYQGVLQNAQQANFLLTNADDGKTYAFKTLTAASRQAADLLIRELPNTQQFRDNADPLGGGVGVRVTQNGDAVALAAYLATVKPYDYSWQPNYGNTFGTTFGQNGGQNPYSGWANSNNFAPDYSEGAGPAQSFQAFIKQLQDDAVANDKKVRSQTSANSLDLSSVNPNSLFGEGYNLFQYGSNSNPNRDLENDFLKRLQSGLLTVGSADYLEASRIAQERYRIAYGIRLETGKPLQFTVAQAQQKANELKLDAINPNELFGQGFDLFKYNSALRANGEAENVLLARLQNGELTPGSADYLQATQIAQERLRVAYSQSLSPPEPKKVSKWKLIVGVVVGAVLTFVTAGAAAPFVASALTGVSVAAASAALTAGFFAGTVMGSVITAIAGVVAGAVGALASATPTTGKLSEGFKAAGNALVSGSVKALVGAAIGLSFASLDLLGTAGTVTETVSNIAANTLSGAISQTILGGGSFADNLKTSAISSVVDAVGKSAANTIGDAFPNTDGKNLANYAAHGVLGCASAAAKGADCAAGAVGAVAGEAAAATGFLDAAANSTIGRNLNKDEVIFFGGLVGGTAAAVASKAEDVNANFATGTATASNAVANNYLNHASASRLAALKGQANCNADCKNEIADLVKLDAANNKALAACEGISSSSCDGMRQDVRNSAAEYIRKNVSPLDAPNGIYNAEKAETLALADGTMSGKTLGTATGFGNTVVDGVVAVGSGMYQVGKAILGDPQAQQTVKDGAGAMWDTVKDPNNWPYLVGAMTPADREKLAVAYETGNGKAVGEILGSSVANLPIGGGGLGTIKKVGGVIDAAGDAAGVARKDPLDWSRPNRTDATTSAHVENSHGNLRLDKPVQGVFYGDPLLVTNAAWKDAQLLNIKPVTVGNRDYYIVPRPNSGYAGGAGGQRLNLDYVTIITETGTNKLVTSIPSGNGMPRGIDNVR